MKIHRGNFSVNKAFLSERIGQLKDKHVLEIGCGNGAIVDWLTKKGIQIVGIDSSKDYIDYAKKNHNGFFKLTTIEHFHTIKNYDIAISFDLIEHLYDVLEHFKMVNRLLHNNGIYLFGTPNKYFNMPYEILRHRSITYYRSYHRSLQTVSSLRKICKQTGFRLKFASLDLRTEYLTKKMVSILGPFGYILSKIPLHKFPPGFQTNIYGVAFKC